MNYEQTIELEENVKIKNRADKLYSDFKKNCRLDVSKYKNGKFTVWSDCHNATYIELKDNTFVFICDFLHEDYRMIINPSSIFGYIKDNYRGLDHLVGMINKFNK